MEEEMRVSTPSDLILSVSAECSILTSVLVGDNSTLSDEEDPNSPVTDSGFSFGQVSIYVTIDDHRVPVATDDTIADGTTVDDRGEVVFCNRAYQRTLTDNEEEKDGLDRNDDFIRTRTANAFNWLAINSGTNVYDLDGDNVLSIKVWASYEESDECEQVFVADDDQAPYGESCAQAFVGSRTLIVEPTKLSVHESVDPTSSPSPDSGSDQASRK